jgi:hypothetical protein
MWRDLATAALKCDFVPRPCPICHKDEYKWLFTDINRREGLALSANLVECRHCGMHYLNPAPEPTDFSGISLRPCRQGESANSVMKVLEMT